MYGDLSAGSGLNSLLATKSKARQFLGGIKKIDVWKRLRDKAGDGRRSGSHCRRGSPVWLQQRSSEQDPAPMRQRV